MPTVKLGKLLYDFPASDSEDLACFQDEVIQIYSEVNPEWSFCQKDGKTGNVPNAFIQLLPEYSVPSAGKLFFAKESFLDTVSGDLPFRKGDIIVGLEQVSEDWWKGQSHNLTGIFPLTLVQQIKVKGEEETVSKASSSGLHIVSSTSNISPAIEESSNDPVDLVRALVTAEAQLSEELSFRSGDIIHVLRRVDDDWLEGTLEGRRGIFLADLTESLSTNTKPKRSDDSKIQCATSSPLSSLTNISNNSTNSVVSNLSSASQSKSHHSSDSGPTEVSPSPHDVEVSIVRLPAPQFVPYTARVLFEFVSQSISELTIREGQLITVTNQIDTEWLEGTDGTKSGIFPSQFVEKDDGSLRMVQPIKEHSVTSYDTRAIALYDFTAELPKEISIKSGDELSILEPFGQEWIKVRTNSGREGLCPSAFLQKIDMSQKSVMRKSNGLTSSTKQTRSTSVLSHLSLDDAVAMEMVNVKRDAERRKSLQPKPAKPPPPSRATSVASTRPPGRPSAAPLGAHKPSSKPGKPVMPPRSYSKGSLSTNESSQASSDPLDRTPAPPTTKPVISEVEPEVQADDEAPVGSEGPVMLKSPPPKPSLPPQKTVEELGADEPEAPIGERPEAVVNEADVVFNEGPLSVKTPPPEVSLNRVSPVSPDPTAPDTMTLTRIPQRAAPPPPGSRRSSRPASAASVTNRRAMSVRVPTRPAPPPPTRPASIQSEPEYDVDVVQELKNKIQVLEEDIRKYNTEIEELDGLHGDGDIDDKLTFYMENINGMTEEVHSLKEQLARFEGARKTVNNNQSEESYKQRLAAEQQKRIRMKEKRERIIKEIIETETSYLKDLQLCMQVFLSPSATSVTAAVDMETLFGNMSEVVDVSQQFLSDLEACVNNVDFQQQIVGGPFVTYIEVMKSAYAPYCRNHDDVCALLEQYKSNEEVTSFIQAKLEELRKYTTVFTLGAFLIKPVQRVLKYPLLLRELEENTQADHPDKERLVEALAAQKDLASHINEYKRRKDLVYKYRSNKDETITEKMSRLNLHSIRKMSNRISMRISTQMGLSDQTKDKAFEQEVTTLKSLERNLKALTRNVSEFMTQLQSTLDNREVVASDLSDYLNSSSPEVEQYLQAQEQISRSVFVSFKSQVDGDLLATLTTAQGLFVSPLKLIEKRKDKMLDYDSWRTHVEKTKDMEKLKVAREGLQKALHDYEALNTQLKYELPQFNKAIGTLLQSCITQFIEYYNSYQSQCLTLLYPLLQNSSLVIGDNNLLQVFEAQNAEVTSRLNANPLLSSTAAVNPASSVKRPADLAQRTKTPANTGQASQSDEVISRLKAQYQPHQLFKVTQEITTSDPMELSVHKGALVGVIMQKDPMGSKERWFVDSGAAKGFVHNSGLQPLAQSPNPSTQASAQVSPSPNQLAVASGGTSPGALRTSPVNSAPVDRLSSDPTDGMHDDPPPEYHSVVAEVAPVFETYKALYKFAARNPNEVSIEPDQVVFVYTKHDEQGRPEWWYIQTNEGYGYAPANYLQRTEDIH